MKRFFRLSLCALILSIPSVSYAADEVKLLKVESVVDAHYGMNSQNPRFEALVANLAHQKQVFIHMKRFDGVWIDVPLRYSRPADANREIWTGTYYNFYSNGSVAPAWDPEFVVKYIVAGRTYWDNNRGANYRIGRNDGTILYGKNLYNGNYSPTHYRTAVYQGWVTLRNIAYAKQVRVVYTTDNWSSPPRVAHAVYSPTFWLFSPDGRRSHAANPGPNGFEEWGFDLQVGTADQVEYAIQYTVAGQSYWDNNYGRNYKVVFR